MRELSGLLGLSRMISALNEVSASPQTNHPTIATQEPMAVAPLNPKPRYPNMVDVFRVDRRLHLCCGLGETGSWLLQGHPCECCSVPLNHKSGLASLCC